MEALSAGETTKLNGRVSGGNGDARCIEHDRCGLRDATLLLFRGDSRDRFLCIGRCHRFPGADKYSPDDGSCDNGESLALRSIMTARISLGRKSLTANIPIHKKDFFLF